METRNHRAAAAPQPANKGAAVPAGKQKAAPGGPDARRQALGDIGNVAIDVLGRKIKLPEGINRPITRSFGAQLLKNAALANKNAVAPAQPPVPARAVPKPARKAPAKPVPRPGQATKKNAAGLDENQKPSASGAAGSSSSVQEISRKKAVSTLTTVLAARSKIACGLPVKQEVIEDIDKLDGDNQLALVDYVEDIYTFYKVAQHECRPSDYMANQPEVNARMRAILTDWLAEAHGKFDLRPETLYLTIYIVDRYLSLQPAPKRELQLVGIAAMLIACKYEEIWAPEVNDFIVISDNTFSREQILAMEKTVLNNMEWNLTVPTTYHFLVRFAKAAGSADEELQHMIRFFGELALMDYRMTLAYPSMVAACAVYAARCTLKKSPLWTSTLKHHTGLHELQLMEGTKILVSSHAAAPEGNLKIVYQKYTTEQFGCVALHPPAAVPGLA